MHELRLVAVSEDGSYAVLVVPGRGGRFSLQIDDRLRAVARGQFSRLAQYEIEVESPLRPKEIQERIRAGETAEEIADAAGVPLERVRWFEGPVLAERAYRAQEAQSALVRRPGDSGSGPSLGDVVTERLTALGSNPEDATWDSTKRTDGTWQVQLLFHTDGRARTAQWLYDPRRRHAAPADDEAARLSLPEADLPPEPEEPSYEATVTQLQPRFSPPAAPKHPSRRAADSRAAEARAAETRAAETRAAETRAAEMRAAEARAAEARAAEAQAVEARAAEARAAEARAAENQRAAAEARATEGRRAAKARAQARAAEAAAAEAEPDNAAEEQDEAAPAQARREERPARRAAGGRGRRSSVPSWDEIMFGSTRPRD